MHKSVRNCESCGKRARVLSTRLRADFTMRRLECPAGHRFTTVEVRPRKSASGRALTAMFGK